MRLHVKFGESQTRIPIGFSETHVIRDSDYEKLRNLPSINGVTVIGDKSIEDYGLHDGKSAYEVAVDNGFVGTEEEWLESLHGQDAVVDDTLSHTGEAADAKATGDAIRAKYTVPLGGIPKNDLSDDVKASLVKIFSFVFDSNYDIVTAPSLQEVLAAIPNAVARVSFTDDSYEAIIPLTDSEGVFSYMIDDTIFTLFYANGSWVMAYDTIPAVDDTLSASGLAADAKVTGDAIREKYAKPASGIPASDLASDVLLLPPISQALVGNYFLHGSGATYSWEQINDISWIELSVNNNDGITTPPSADSVARTVENCIDLSGRFPAIHLTLSGGTVISLPLTGYKRGSSIYFGAVSGGTIYSIILVKKPNTPYYYSYSHKELTAAGLGAIAAPDSPVSGQVLTYNGSSWVGSDPVAGTDDYEDLQNKPEVNGVTLSGNKSLSNLGIEPEALIVTITQSGSGYSASKKFSEIALAVAAGRRVAAIYDGTVYELHKVIPESYIALFTAVYQTDARVIAIDDASIAYLQNMTLGTYSMPSGGIPKSDLASTVQGSLDNADTAYQKPGTGIPSSDLASAVQALLNKANSAYQAPSSGIPATDLEPAVQAALENANSAYQKPNTGIPATDMASAVQTALERANSAYQKPNTGIPSSDLASGISVPVGGNVGQVLRQTANGPAWDDEGGGGATVFDCVIDENTLQSIDGPTLDEVQAAAPNVIMRVTFNNSSEEMYLPLGDGLGFFSSAGNGNIIILYPAYDQYDVFRWFLGSIVVPAYTSDLINDSGYLTQHQSLAAYRTAADQDVIDAAKGTYSKPITGIPKSDLASSVQASLGKADSALQSAPVTSVNGQTGDVALSIPTVPSNVSAFTNDAGYLTQHQDITGKLDKNQGSGNANKYMKVGSTGELAPVALGAGDIGAIPAPSSPSAGDFLCWNGSAWVARSLSVWQGGNYGGS